MAKLYPSYKVWHDVTYGELQIGLADPDETVLPEEEELGEFAREVPESRGVWSLLDEFNLECKLGVLQGAELPKGRSKIELEIVTSAAALNLNPVTYNHVVNLHRLF